MGVYTSLILLDQLEVDTPKYTLPNSYLILELLECVFWFSAKDTLSIGSASGGRQSR